MDVIKQQVAAFVQDAVKKLENVDIPPASNEPVESVEAQVVSDLQTVLRVVVTGYGVRYFTVRVSENI